MNNTLSLLNAFLSGAFMTALAIGGLFFFKFWKQSRDRLFLQFAVAFWMLAAERIPLVFYHHSQEPGSLVYLVRLCAFLIILSAIYNKNRVKN